MSDQKKFILLFRKVHFRTWAEIRADRYYRSRSEDAESQMRRLQKFFSEDCTEKHLCQTPHTKPMACKHSRTQIQKGPKVITNPLPILSLAKVQT